MEELGEEQQQWIGKEMELCKEEGQMKAQLQPELQGSFEM